jgi:hypothetical protein
VTRWLKNRRWSVGVGLVGAVLLILAWAGLTWFVILFHQVAPDLVLSCGPHYNIWHWPGVLMTKPLDPGNEPPLPVPEFKHGDTQDEIQRVGSVDGFIVGVTDHGWFAIGAATGKISYPFTNATELKTAVGIEFDEKQISSGFPWGLMAWKKDVWKIPVVTGTLCTISLAAFLTLWVWYSRQKPKVSPIESSKSS